MNVKMTKWFGFLLLVLLALFGYVRVAQADTRGMARVDTVTYNQGGYTLIVTNNDPAFDATLMQRMIDTFFIVYPKLAARFNPDTTQTVPWTIDPNETGVAYTFGGGIVFGADYMKTHPEDIDVVTHEAMHIVQAYTCSVDGWLVEGIADYVRHIYGVNNAAAGWSLPAYSSSQSYTNAYGVTARFLVWLELRVRSTIVNELDAAARNCTYSNPGTWTALTGQTPDQLWAQYGANPDISGPTPTPVPTLLPLGPNLALNKPATASASCNADESAAKAFNGSWTSGVIDKWCDSASASKWLQVDLGANLSLTKFRIYHAGGGGESGTYNTKDFNIQVSTDNVTWTTVATVAGNTANITTSNIPARTARYVRLNVITPEQGTNGAARIYEMLVYGSSGPVATATRTPTPVGPTATRTLTPVGPTATRTPTPASGNLALNKPATASASCNANEGPAKAVNGTWNGGGSDKWCDNSSASKWWQVDLGANFNLTQFVIQHAGAGGESATLNTRDFNLQVSTNASAWTTVASVSANTANSTTHNIAATSARYVRLNITAPEQGGSGAARIYEVLVYGAGAPVPSATVTRTPTSSSAGVIFYQDINFGGVASAAIAKGDYASLPAGVPNDWMSSLRVPAGWIVDAYADGNFAGAVCTYTADTSWVGTACNDVMSSFRIR